MGGQGVGGLGDPMADTLMVDTQEAANGPEAGALPIQFEGLLPQGQVVAMRLALDGEVAATVLTAIALRCGMVQAALDDVFGVPTLGASWITHASIVSLLS